MQGRRARTSPPRQLLIALDSTRLRGMSPHDRRQAVTWLATLLAEPAGAAAGMERGDGGEGDTPASDPATQGGGLCAAATRCARLAHPSPRVSISVQVIGRDM